MSLLVNVGPLTVALFSILSLVPPAISRNLHGLIAVKQGLVRLETHRLGRSFITLMPPLALFSSRFLSL